MGTYLLSTSSADTSMLIWAVSTWEYSALHRISGGGIPRALWSPNSISRIFSTTPTDLFRIWTYDDTNYRCKNWSTVDAPVEAFAWHPCAGFVIFSSASMLYSLNFTPPSVEFTESSLVPKLIPLFDIKECLVPQAQSPSLYKVGGRVVQMEWDPSGNRLAVVFADSELVALFRLMPSADTALLPCGFIRGHDGEWPLTIAFQKDFTAGALLSIAWSSERLQYFPFIFGGCGYGTKHTFKNVPNSDTLYSSNKPNAGADPNTLNPAEAGAGDTLHFKTFSHGEE